MISTSEKIKRNPEVANVMGWTVLIVFITAIVLICTVFANNINQSTLEESISKLVRAKVGEFTYQDLGKMEMEPMRLMTEKEQKNLTNLLKNLHSTASFGAPHIYRVQTKYANYQVMVDPNKHIAMNAIKKAKK